MVADNDAPTLPSSQTERWTPARKAAVIEGIRQGLLTIEQACERTILQSMNIALGSATSTRTAQLSCGHSRRHLSQGTAHELTARPPETPEAAAWELFMEIIAAAA
jgi:hypothetical protein